MWFLCNVTQVAQTFFVAGEESRILPTSSFGFFPQIGCWYLLKVSVVTISILHRNILFSYTALMRAKSPKRTSAAACGLKKKNGWNTGVKNEIRFVINWGGTAIPRRHQEQHGWQLRKIGKHGPIPPNIFKYSKKENKI